MSIKQSSLHNKHLWTSEILNFNYHVLSSPFLLSSSTPFSLLQIFPSHYSNLSILFASNIYNHVIRREKKKQKYNPHFITLNANQTATIHSTSETIRAKSNALSNFPQKIINTNKTLESKE